MTLTCNARQLSFRKGAWQSGFELKAESPEALKRPVVSQEEKLISDFVEAIPAMRVFPTEDELGSFWRRCISLEKVRLLAALRNRLESSQRDAWQVQARILRVILSAFGQEWLGRMSSLTLNGQGQELLRQFRCSEVYELREEAAKLWQLLELSWSMPNENPLQMAKQGGLLAFTEPAACTTNSTSTTSVKSQAPVQRAKQLGYPTKQPQAPVDLLDLRPSSPKHVPAIPVGQASAKSKESKEFTGSANDLADLVWQPSPERFQLGVDEDESGNQDLERMYSFVRPPRATAPIPYIPATAQVTLQRARDPFDFVSDEVRQMQGL